MWCFEFKDLEHVPVPALITTVRQQPTPYAQGSSDLACAQRLRLRVDPLRNLSSNHGLSCDKPKNKPNMWLSFLFLNVRFGPRCHCLAEMVESADPTSVWEPGGSHIFEVRKNPSHVRPASRKLKKIESGQVMSNPILKRGKLMYPMVI